MVFSSSDLEDLFHFVRCYNSDIYSLFQRFQKYWCRLCINCYLDNLVSGRCVKWMDLLPSIRPMRKWAGVKDTKSFGSDDIGVSGREFSVALIW